MTLHKIKRNKLVEVIQTDNIREICRQSGADYMRTWRAVKKSDGFVYLGNKFILEI